jgi:acid stress-induced BolA-like protein IbaG/YrbA
LVYQTLTGQMHDDAEHALSLRTFTRAAWQQR